MELLAVLILKYWKLIIAVLLVSYVAKYFGA